MKSILIISLILVSLHCILAKDIYDFSKSKLQKITQMNFDNQITKNRATRFIYIVQFYKEGDGKSKDFSKEFDQFASDYQGIFKIGVVNCDSEIHICSKEKITSYPTIRFYPPNPIPTFDYEGDLNTNKIITTASRYLQNNVIEVTSENAETFISESPAVPKVLLFTDKKGIPVIFKGLSLSFEKKLFFGIVRSSDQALLDKYKISKTPAIIVIKSNEKKPFVYKGEMKFNQIFEFLNVYSEAFVAGGGSSQDSAATKSWLTEVVPEMTEQSANDICLKQEGVLCVILINKGKPEKSLIEVLKQAHKNFERKMSRGSKFGFMWLDNEIESKWVELFKVQKFPSLVVLNPGKRKRYLQHQGEINQKSISDLLERINGGDARFAAISGSLPEFVLREKK